MGWNELLSGPFWIRLGVALACGAAIGFERQLRGKPAGMRTSMLVMWVLAAIAAAVALDHVGAAIATTLTTVGILVGLNAIEQGFISMRRGVHSDEQNPPSENRYSGPWGP